MPSWLALAAHKHPDRFAVEAPERTLTYAELWAQAARAAASLKRLAGGRAEPVALALAPGAEFAIALHACLLTGAAAVPIDLRLREEERARRLAGAGLVLTEPLAGDDVGLVETAEVSERDALAVMHTSGTTADPRPVVLTYGNFLASALGSAVAIGLDPGERWLCPMPLTHVGGLSIPIRSAIYATTAVLHGRFETDAVLDELMDRSRRITLVSLVPTMLGRLLDAGLAAPPTLRWALLGGGPIAPALLERAAAAGVPVAPSYGMTEACSQIATFGWPLPGVDLALRGERGAEKGAEKGEILVRGPIVSEGCLSADGWLHTGDVGLFDERGALAVTGREADTIVTGGENIAPAEVEAVLAGHPAVADAAVIGRPDAEWGEALVALIVCRPGTAATAEELRAHCRTRLAAFKVPKVVELVDDLPRSPSGKLLRRRLG